MRYASSRGSATRPPVSADTEPSRSSADGAADLVAATSRWKPWLPPKADQGLQQGGAFVFEGDRLLFQHRDPSTGAHADLNTLLRVALEA